MGRAEVAFGLPTVNDSDIVSRIAVRSGCDPLPDFLSIGAEGEERLDEHLDARARPLEVIPAPNVAGSITQFYSQIHAGRGAGGRDHRSALHHSSPRLLLLVLVLQSLLPG